MPRGDPKKSNFVLDEMMKNGRAFDQKTLMAKFDTAASAFGFCKALCVSWIKRKYRNEGFWEEWLTSPDEGIRKQAETAICQMSRDEVVDVGVLNTYKGAAVGVSEPLYMDALNAKKAWHMRYLKANGIVVTPQAGPTPIDPVRMGREITQTRGYQLLYLSSAKEAAHCIAIYSGRGDSLFFDPNFGELKEGAGFSSFLKLMDVTVDDYSLMFLLGGHGKLAQYRTEKIASAVE